MKIENQPNISHQLEHYPGAEPQEKWESPLPILIGKDGMKLIRATIGQSMR